jgi:hypothetical protein
MYDDSPPQTETQRLKQVIFKADDFGLSPAVNAGIELAHRDGVLDAASLMVGAAAAAEAVACARRNPTLKVGLHLVVVANRAVLPPAVIPAPAFVIFFCRTSAASWRPKFAPSSRPSRPPACRSTTWMRIIICICIPPCWG